MKSISLKTKIITGLITGGMLLSSVSLALATTTKPLNNAIKSSQQIQNKTQRQKDLQTNLAKLVTDKTITQNQSDKIKAAMIKYTAEKKANFEKTKAMTKEQRKTYMDAYKVNHINPLKALVENGTITQAQAGKIGFGGHGNLNGKAPFAKTDALKCSERIQRDAERQKKFQTNLAKLVTDKTITQEQSNKIKATMLKAEALKKADVEKTKAMTKEQRKAYMDANMANHINPLKALVDNGTITQAQAEKVGLGGHSGAGAGRHMSEVKSK